MPSTGSLLLSKEYFEDLMHGRKQSSCWGAVLAVLSLLTGAAIRLRRICFGLHLFKRKGLPCPVISVGNITLGGTGKTPAVIQIAGLLLRKRLRPAVVSRGYGRKDEAETVIVSDGSSMLADPDIGGDEPVLIGAKLPGVPVVVGRNRHQAASVALQRFLAEVVILDDGFQHVQLKRDLDIVLVDAGNPFGNGRLFPKGVLREPLAALKRADAVLITKTEGARELEALKKVIRENTHARIFTSRQVPVDLIDFHGGKVLPLSSLRGARVLALAGIARPASFFELIQSLGAEIAAVCVYADHFRYQKTDLAKVYRKAADANIGMIVTTEKDAVRLKNMNAEGFWSLRIELSVVEREEWNRFS